MSDTSNANKLEELGKMKVRLRYEDIKSLLMLAITIVDYFYTR